MTAEVIQLRNYQKPVAQDPSLLAQATTLVDFINELTTRDIAGPVEFNAALHPYTETESYSAPDGDAG